MDPVSLAFALLAGVLSTLSPCVLPLVPIVLGTAAAEHRWGPAALAAGLALSFTVIGLFVATLGFAAGLDGDVFRVAGGAVMMLIGAILVVPGAQARLAMAAAPVQAWTETRFGGASTAGLRGQLGLGVLLGAVWSPCVGPTLGAASVMAARGENLGAVALTMAVFGIGAALPLLLLGALSRQAMLRLRGRLLAAGSGGKLVLGLVFLALGLAIMSGFDKLFEAWLVDISPDWLTRLTTRF
jgi:cytochrome c-type biogenesis protein